MADYRRSLRTKPRKVVAEYTDKITKVLGAEDGRAWTYEDYSRKAPWGKLFDLKRCFYPFSAIVKLLDEDKGDQAHAMMVQLMKALEQFAIDHGSWRNAWYYSGMDDPMGKRRFAGTDRETEVISAWITELSALETKMTQRGGPAIS